MTKSEDDRFQREVCDRANYICQRCKKDFSYSHYFNAKGINQYVCAHHIKTKKAHPQLRFVLENGVCLCDDCHKLVHAGSSLDDVTDEKTKQFMKRGAKTKQPKKKFEKIWGMTKPPSTPKKSQQTPKPKRKGRVQLDVFYNKKTGRTEKVKK